MAIFISPYDTTALSAYVMSPTITQLIAILRTDYIHSIHIRPSDYDQSFNIHSVQGGNSVADVIKYFNHPIVIRDMKDVDNSNIFIDSRHFGRMDNRTNSFQVRNMVEYKMMVMRAAMNYFWLSRKPTIFRDMTILPVKLYAGMVSETVRKTYSLDPGDQIKIAILAAYFYLGLFTNESKFSDMEHHRVVSQIMSATNAGASLVDEVIEGLPIIPSITEFCEVCKERTGSIRLDDFSVGILISAIGSVWYGTNSREILAVCLEHPPTWLVLLYHCVKEATFRRSPLAKLADNYNRGNTADAMCASINSLFGGDKKLDELFAIN